MFCLSYIIFRIQKIEGKCHKSRLGGSLKAPSSGTMLSKFIFFLFLMFQCGKFNNLFYFSTLSFLLQSLQGSGLTRDCNIYRIYRNMTFFHKITITCFCSCTLSTIAQSVFHILNLSTTDGLYIFYFVSFGCV